MQPTIKFSFNWNEKLLCKYFTTLRLHNPDKYRIGEKYNIELNSATLKKAQIVNIKGIKLADINEYIAGIDTGYTVKETKNILIKMYPKTNWDRQIISFILLKTLS